MAWSPRSTQTIYLYDYNTLSYVEWDGSLETGNLTIGAVTQSGPWTATVTGGDLSSIATNTGLRSLSIGSGSVSGLGNNTLITPTAGKKIRLAYASYNPSLAVEAAFRFGASGTLFLRNSVAAGSVVAKDFGDMRYVEGAVNDPLILNLSVGVSVVWNALYTEV